MRGGLSPMSRAAAALAAAVLAGCVSSNVRPAVRVVDSGAIGLRGPEVAPAADWWLALNDPQLDRIMREALIANPTLDVVLARVRLASAGVQSQRAGLQPQVAIDALEQPTRLSGAFEIPPPFAGSDRWVGSVLANLSWTLDLAGRQRALISQARNASEAAALDFAAARVALSAAIAETYVGLALSEERTRIAEAFVRSREQSLALARSRARNDLDSDFDLRASETLLAQAQQALDRASGERALMIHALAALSGRGADAYPGVTASSVRFSASLPLPASLPANLLERRPDILAVRARIAAASAGQNVARADFYPSVDLRAFLGVSAVNLSQQLTGKALTYGAGPAIHVPVFEGGRLRAQYKAATAELDAATASYNALTLRAVQQAADTLSTIDTNAAEAADQRRVVNGLAETVRLDEVRVRTGLGTRLDILAAGDRLLQARQTQADLDAEGLTRRIQLLVAVGGDFNPDSHAKLAADDRAATPGAKP